MVGCWAHSPGERLDFLIVRQALELFQALELPQQWDRVSRMDNWREFCSSNAASVPVPKTARAWLEALSYLSDAQIDEAVSYATEAEEPQALIDMDDDDFEEMIEEMTLGDDEASFRAAVATISTAQAPGGNAAAPLQAVVTPASLADKVAAWLPTLRLFDDEQIETVLAYTQQEGTLADLQGMDNDDFSEMLGELGLSDEADAVTFRAAVAAIDNEPAAAEDCEADAHRLVRGVSPSAVAEAAPPAHVSGCEPEPKLSILQAASELEQWLRSHYPHEWHKAQLLAQDKSKIVSQMLSKDEEIRQLKAEMEALKQLRAQ